MIKKISGIYKITNKITNECYIGSSKDVKRRWANHKSPSKWVEGLGMKLYQAFNKYGLDNFLFEIVEETDNLHEREQYWIGQLNPAYNSNNANGWNMERYRELSKKRSLKWRKSHREEYLAMHKVYYETHKEEQLDKIKKHQNRLCLYEGEKLTLNALRLRFRNRGIPNSMVEAKKYLIIEETK